MSKKLIITQKAKSNESAGIVKKQTNQIIKKSPQIKGINDSGYNEDFSVNSLLNTTYDKSRSSLGSIASKSPNAIRYSEASTQLLKTFHASASKENKSRCSLAGKLPLSSSTPQVNASKAITSKAVSQKAAQHPISQISASKKPSVSSASSNSVTKSVTQKTTPSIGVSKSVTQKTSSSSVSKAVTQKSALTPKISVSKPATQKTISKSVPQKSVLTPSTAVSKTAVQKSGSAFASKCDIIKTVSTPSISVSKSAQKSVSTPSVNVSKQATQKLLSTPSTSASKSAGLINSLTPTFGNLKSALQKVMSTPTSVVSKSAIQRTSVTPSVTKSATQRPSVTSSVTKSATQRPSVTPSVTKSATQRKSVTPSLTKSATQKFTSTTSNSVTKTTPSHLKSTIQVTKSSSAKCTPQYSQNNNTKSTTSNNVVTPMIHCGEADKNAFKINVNVCEDNKQCEQNIKLVRKHAQVKYQQLYEAGQWSAHVKFNVKLEEFFSQNFEPTSRVFPMIKQNRLNGNSNCRRNVPMKDAIKNRNKKVLFGDLSLTCGTFYLSSSIDHMMNLERVYFKTSSDIPYPLSAPCRMTYVNWFIKLQKFYGCDHNTLYTAVTLFDKAIESKLGQNKKLIGIASLWLSMKYHCVLQRTVQGMVKAGHGTFTAREICNMELSILRINKFNIPVYDITTFVNYYLIILPNLLDDKKLLECAHFLLTCSYLYSKTLQPSFITASAVYTSLCILGYPYRQMWHHVKEHPGYHNIESLNKDKDFIIDLLKERVYNTEPMNEAVMMYSSEAHFKISLIVKERLKTF